MFWSKKVTGTFCQRSMHLLGTAFYQDLNESNLVWENL